MALKREPLIKTHHVGPDLAGPGEDTDTANRLALALPFILDTSKSFARSLIENQRSYGWSPKQRDWAHRLIQQAREEYRRQNPRQGAKPDVYAVLNNAALAKVLDLFRKAGQSLKKPMIRLSIAGRMAHVIPGREGGLALFWSVPSAARASPAL